MHVIHITLHWQPAEEGHARDPAPCTGSQQRRPKLFVAWSRRRMLWDAGSCAQVAMARWIPGGACCDEGFEGRVLLCTAGHDEINIHGVKEHESYRGDRTATSLTGFADTLAPSAGQPHHYIRCAPPGLTRAPAVPDAPSQEAWTLMFLACGLCRCCAAEASLADCRGKPVAWTLPVLPVILFCTPLYTG
jgi:hypothetical protein